MWPPDVVFSPMFGYSVYGGCLRSEVAFPSLPPARGAAHWRLRRMAGVPEAGALEPLGEDRVDGDVRVRLARRAGGFRLTYDDTGIFDVLAGGARIHWYPGEGAAPEAVRLDVLGRVLPLALHASGTLCLHGSAVEMGGRGLAFLAPKRHGKSTLARALVRGGAALVSDDVVAVDPRSAAPRMRPGVPQVRLWGDSAARLASGADARTDMFGKLTIDATAGERSAAGDVPLSAIYLLAPVRAGAPSAARRTPLPPTAAAMALLPEARLAPLLGKGEGASLLEGAVRLAGAVPVYTLEVVRDFDRLAEVVDQLREWHQAPARDRGAAMVDA